MVRVATDHGDSDCDSCDCSHTKKKPPLVHTNLSPQPPITPIHPMQHIDSTKTIVQNIINLTIVFILLMCLCMLLVLLIKYPL